MSHTPEPWQYAEHGLRIINGEPTPDWSAEDAQRAVESVNATQGMADPAKEIAEMKEALKEASDALKFIASNWTGQDLRPGETIRQVFHAEKINRANAALAKIQTILKP